MNTLKHILCIGVLWCLALTASAIDYPTYQPQPIGGIHNPAKQTINQSGVVDNPRIVHPGFIMKSTSSYIPQGSSSSNNGPSNSGPRRIKFNGDGSYHGEEKNGQYWDEDEGEWVNELVIGMLRIETVDGATNTYIWNGSSWDLINSIADPNVPIGSLPFLLMLLLCGGYVVMKKRKEANLA